MRRGNAEMTQVGDQLSQIIHQVQDLAPQMQQVSEGMQAQSGGAEQIEQALISAQAKEFTDKLGLDSEIKDGVFRARVILKR